MIEQIQDKNIELNGKVIGSSSVIKLSVKTALWIISTIFVIVMSILSYSYVDLKKKNQEFVETVDEKMDEIKNDVTNIRLGQEGIKGDIKLILDRQNRDNPINTNHQPIQPTNPPSIPNVINTTSGDITPNDTIN